MRKLYIIVCYLFFSACSTPNVERYILYKSIDLEKLNLDDGLAISEENKRMLTYKTPFSEEYFSVDTDVGYAAFEYQITNDVVFDAATKISIPIDLESTAWHYKNIKCQSEKYLNEYQINCRRENIEWSYLYNENTGIVKLQFPCEVMEFCDYVLESDSGIFSRAALERFELR